MDLRLKDFQILKWKKIVSLKDCIAVFKKISLESTSWDHRGLWTIPPILKQADSVCVIITTPQPSRCAFL